MELYICIGFTHKEILGLKNQTDSKETVSSVAGELAGSGVYMAIGGYMSSKRACSFTGDNENDNQNDDS